MGGTDPACPVCSKPVSKGIPVVFEHGEVLHIQCRTRQLTLSLELLKEAAPKISRVMFLHEPQAAPTALKLTEEAAPRLGITLQVAQVGAADELPRELR